MRGCCLWQLKEEARQRDNQRVMGNKDHWLGMRRYFSGLVLCGGRVAWGQCECDNIMKLHSSFSGFWGKDIKDDQGFDHKKPSFLGTS